MSSHGIERSIRNALLAAVCALHTGCVTRECECRCVVDKVEVCSESAKVQPAKPGALAPPSEMLAFNYEAARDLQVAGETRASLGFVEKVINIDPSYKDIYFLRGFGLQQTGALAEAMESYRRHLQRFPEDDKAWFNLGHAQLTSDQCGDAIASFQQSQRLDPNRPATHEHLATCYERLGRKESAAAERALAGQAAEAK